MWLTSVFLLLDAVLADQIDHVYTGQDHIVTLVMKHLQVASIHLSFFFFICMHDIMKGGDQELDTPESQVGFNGTEIQGEESPDEMCETTHLNELETPLSGFLILFVAASHSADYLEWIKELVNVVGVKYLLPDLLVLLHAEHTREILNLLEEFLIGWQLLQQVPSTFNKDRFTFSGKQIEQFVIVLLLLADQILRVVLRNVVLVLEYEDLLDHAKFPQIAVIILIRINILIFDDHVEFIDLEAKGISYLDSQMSNSLEVAGLDVFLHDFRSQYNWNGCILERAVSGCLDFSLQALLALVPVKELWQQLQCVDDQVIIRWIQIGHALIYKVCPYLLLDFGCHYFSIELEV